MEHKGIKPWTPQEFKEKRPDAYNELNQQRQEYNK